LNQGYTVLYIGKYASLHRVEISADVTSEERYEKGEKRKKGKFETKRKEKNGEMRMKSKIKAKGTKIKAKGA
jgi:hypothetical protein